MTAAGTPQQFEAGHMTDKDNKKVIKKTRTQRDVLQHNLLTVSKWSMALSAENEDLKQRLAEASANIKQPRTIIKKSGNSAGKKRGTAAVIAWDMAHNPVGRAIVIYDLLERDYDVELIGPLWSRYGEKIWKPIEAGHRNIRSFRVETLNDFYPAALAFSESEKYDLVVSCKPRLPSLLLGMLLKKNSGCPLVVDVDDFELSFFKDETTATLDALKAAGSEALLEPFEELPTRMCNGLVSRFDAVLVSNCALQDKFGGYIIRHARDEDIFHSKNFDRNAARKQLGIADDEFALVFVGTARPHKGVFLVADALEKLGDDRFSFHIIGDIGNKRISNRLNAYKKAKIKLHPGCDFADLPFYLSAADAVPLLQDVNHPISQFQIPAKVSDAAAFGLPILTTNVPPLSDLAHSDMINIIDEAELIDGLRRLAEEKSNEVGAQKRKKARISFESELGLSVNRERLLRAIDQAAESDETLHPDLEAVLNWVHSAYVDLQKKRIGHEPKLRFKSGKTQRDMVMFWKQNDSGLYGRRSDMLMQHFLKVGAVNSILQFDAAIPIQELSKLAEASDGPRSHAAQVLKHTVNNALGLNDKTRYKHRTYIYGKNFSKTNSLVGGADKKSYPDWAKKQLLKSKIDSETAIGWVCPVVLDFPTLNEELDFDFIIADIIDDQRAFKARPKLRKIAEESYAETLPLADLVLTNCAPNIHAFEGLTKEMHLIANGAELPRKNLECPENLKIIKRPIAGYIGNLRDRIAWDLLDAVALKLPHVSFVIIGGGAREEDIAEIQKRENVIFLGAIPYKDLQAYLAEFDVALVPHLNTNLTKSMNPLKIYNYFAAKKPIVSTGVANIDEDLKPYICFADTAEGFAKGIEKALENEVEFDANYNSVLKNITWDERVKTILELVDMAKP